MVSAMLFKRVHHNKQKVAMGFVTYKNKFQKLLRLGQEIKCYNITAGENNQSAISLRTKPTNL